MESSKDEANSDDFITRISIELGKIRFKLFSEQPVGAGGFGQVYKIQNMDTDVICACKVITGAGLTFNVSRSSFDQLIQKEVGAMKEFGPLPGMLPLYDYIICHDFSLLIMKYCSGGSIDTYINQRNGLEMDENTLIVLCKKILVALYNFHNKNKIHRDIKPGNILLDENGDIYLADYGLVDDLTGKSQISTVAGTSRYYSPEIFNGLVGQSYYSDIWAVGVVLLELSFGSDKFNNSDLILLNQQKVLDIFSNSNYTSEFSTFVSKFFIVNYRDRPLVNSLLQDQIMKKSHDNRVKSSDLRGSELKTIDNKAPRLIKRNFRYIMYIIITFILIPIIGYLLYVFLDTESETLPEICNKYPIVCSTEISKFQKYQRLITLPEFKLLKESKVNEIMMVIANGEKVLDIGLQQNSEVYLTDKGHKFWKSFKILLMVSDHIEDLYIYHKSIGNDGMKVISQAFPYLKNLTRLYIPGNFDQRMNFQILTRNLRQLSELTQLMLDQNGIQDTKCSYIIQILKNLPKLKFFSISDNEITDICFLDIIIQFKKMTNLEVIYFHNNPITPAIIEDLKKVLKHHKTITYFTINSKTMPSDVISELAIYFDKEIYFGI